MNKIDMVHGPYIQEVFCCLMHKETWSNNKSNIDTLEPLLLFTYLIKYSWMKRSMVIQPYLSVDLMNKSEKGTLTQICLLRNLSLSLILLWETCPTLTCNVYELQLNFSSFQKPMWYLSPKPRLRSLINPTSWPVICLGG